MADTNNKLPLGATPGKLVLVGVLAVVFVAVLIFQFGGTFFPSTGERNPSPVTTPARASAEQVVDPSTPEKRSAEKKPRPSWPPATLDEALACDPFAVSSALAVLLGPEPEPEQTAGVALDEAAQLRAAKLQEVLATLRNQGVSMIFDKGEGPIATVGDQTLQIGDLIGGFRVIDISVEQGVVLEPFEEEENQNDTNQ